MPKFWDLRFSHFFGIGILAFDIRINMEKLDSVKISFYVLGILFFIAIIIWSFIFSSPQFASVLGGQTENSAKIFFFDVGQGAAVFIETPNKNQILIDGGPGSQILNKLGEAMAFFDRKIDIVILTHPDADHLNGLIDVLKNYEVKQVVEPCVNDSGSGYGQWLALLGEKKISRLCARAGQKIKLDKEITIEIIFPFESLAGQSIENTNSASIVTKLSFGENDVLLTGDAEKATEYQLVNSGVDLRSQILQVGHHGSKSSASEEFLKAVAPEISVIQVGKNNRYGHPAQEVLDRLKNIGAEIFRTDLGGDMEFLCDVEKCLKR
jgi:competence protein ComEC